MSSETFSRSFLQGIPEQCKQDIINQMIRGFIGDLRNAAAIGKTTYMYNTEDQSYRGQRGVTPHVITNKDLISAFEKKFPGCDISYQENWIDIDSNKKVLKKGIVIDWS